MISDVIIALIYDFFMMLVNGREPLRFNIDSSVYEYISDFIAFIFYILPMGGLVVIFRIIVSIIVFRVIISVVKTIWNLLPVL